MPKESLACFARFPMLDVVSVYWVGSRLPRLDSRCNDVVVAAEGTEAYTATADRSTRKYMYQLSCSWSGR